MEGREGMEKERRDKVGKKRGGTVRLEQEEEMRRRCYEMKITQKPCRSRVSVNLLQPRIHLTRGR